MPDDTLQTVIEPLAENLIAKIARRGLLYAAGILGGAGVTLASSDGFQSVSSEIALEVVSLLLFIAHWVWANRSQLRAFNLGRGVQAGVVGNAVTTILPKNNLKVYLPTPMSTGVSEVENPVYDGYSAHK